MAGFARRCDPKSLQESRFRKKIYTRRRISMSELNKYSKVLTQDETQPAAQAMLYGIGLTDEDLQKAQVGVVSMGYDGNTCNMHLNDLAKLVKQGVWDNDLVGLIFNPISV